MKHEIIISNKIVFFFCIIFIICIAFNQITIQLDQLRRLQKQNSSVANTQENEILNDQGIDTRHVNNDSEEFGENSGSIQEHSRAKATGNQNYTEYIDENDVGNQTYCSELSTIEEIENENEYENDFEANNLLSSLSNIKSTLIKQMMNEQVKEAKGRKELKQSKNSNQSDDSLNKPLLTITPAKVMLKRLNDNIVQQFEHDNHDTNKNIEIKSKKFKKKN